MNDAFNLITPELKLRFAQLGDQDIPDPVIVAKFFTCWSNWTWYAIAYDSEPRHCFGYCVGFEAELGYFSIEELESIEGPGGLRIERDLYWSECLLSELKAKLQENRGI